MKLLSAVGIVALVAATACAPSAPKVNQVVVGVHENPVAGTVTRAWEEPMYDQVAVPGRLDPTGTYYIPAHRTVIEVRQGRWQRVRYPKDSASK